MLVQFFVFHPTNYELKENYWILSRFCNISDSLLDGSSTSHCKKILYIGLLIRKTKNKFGDRVATLSGFMSSHKGLTSHSGDRYFQNFTACELQRKYLLPLGLLFLRDHFCTCVFVTETATRTCASKFLNMK